jgi:hypothetical protein
VEFYNNFNQGVSNPDAKHKPGLILSAFEQHARVNQSEVLLIPNAIGDGIIDQMEACWVYAPELGSIHLPGLANGCTKGSFKP